MLQRLVVVMGRWPAPWRCKRRLATGLGAERAAAVQQRLQQHTLMVLDQACQQLACDGVVAVGGVGPRAARRLAAAHPGLAVQLQGPGGLGLRMQRQFARAFQRGYRQVVLVGSDLPALSWLDLQAALLALEQQSLVLGPAADGGYWLVGLAEPAPVLFTGISWGGALVLQQTLQRAKQLGLRPGLLATHADLDRPADLRRWR